MIDRALSSMPAVTEPANEFVSQGASASGDKQPPWEMFGLDEAQDMPHRVGAGRSPF